MGRLHVRRRLWDGPELVAKSTLGSAGTALSRGPQSQTVEAAGSPPSAWTSSHVLQSGTQRKYGTCWAAATREQEFLMVPQLLPVTPHRVEQSGGE